MPHHLFSQTRSNRIPDSWSLLTYLQYVIYGSSILYFGRDVLVPLSFGVLISFVLYPSCAWMEKHGVSRMTAILINVGILTLLFAMVSFLLAQQFLSFLQEWPIFQTKLLALLREISRFLTNSFALSNEEQSKWLVKLTDQLTGGIWSFLQNAISFSAFSMVMLILVPIYSILILYYRHNWVKVLYRLFPNERNENIREILLLTIQAYFNFIKGMGLVYLFVGILNSLGLLLLGVPHAILFGFIASILTARFGLDHLSQAGDGRGDISIA